MSDIENTLNERLKTYGKFENHAKISQSLKDIMRQFGLDKLPNDMREALEMIQHKIARILNGDPAYLDNWHDIIGYARLVEKRLEENQKEIESDNKRGNFMNYQRDKYSINKILSNKMETIHSKQKL